MKTGVIEHMTDEALKISGYDSGSSVRAQWMSGGGEIIGMRSVLWAALTKLPLTTEQLSTLELSPSG